jgi:hypothetical protein
MDNVHFQPTNPGVYKYGRRPFRRRQFDDVPTKPQFNFDVTFRLVIPVLCFLFDPVVFPRRVPPRRRRFPERQALRVRGELHRDSDARLLALRRPKVPCVVEADARRCGALIVGP